MFWSLIYPMCIMPSKVILMALEAMAASQVTGGDIGLYQGQGPQQWWSWWFSWLFEWFQIQISLHLPNYLLEADSSHNTSLSVSISVYRKNSNNFRLWWQLLDSWEWFSHKEPVGMDISWIPYTPICKLASSPRYTWRPTSWKVICQL